MKCICNFIMNRLIFDEYWWLSLSDIFWQLGLQKRIVDINPCALYVPCAAHSPNLVVNDATESSLEIINFFFAASTAHLQTLSSEVPTLTLKPLSTGDGRAELKH